MTSKLCPAVTFVALLIAFTHSGGAQRFPQQSYRQPQYSSGQQQYNSGQPQYSSGQQQYSSGQQQYNTAPQATARQGAAFNCPERYGYYANPSQCDAYYKCSDGVASEELCPDGLLFNDKASPFTFPCQYPNDVTCEGRSALQPAQPTEQCPHQYGYFKLGDAQNCGQFVNCAAGRGYVIDCPDGLAFDERTYHCDWPDKVPSCDAEAYLGFRCPEESRLFNQGEAEYRYFRSPNDCQRYFICVEGRPRRYNCGEGRAYNELISACDGIENVTGCALPARQQNPENNLFNYRG